MGKYQQSTAFEQTTFDLNNVLPSFNVLSVLKDVFATNGYNLIGNIFDNPKFTELFQSFSCPWDTYKSIKQTPYYLKFHCNGGLRKYSTQKGRQNTSSSAEEFDDDKFRFCADIPLYSDNATISNVINKYEMMKTSDDTSFSRDAKTIIIPVSGWYQIHFNGSLNLPDKGRCDRGNPVTVTGWDSRDDRTDFLRSAYEVQLKRGIPKENPRYYCWNFALPLVPVDYTESETSPSVLYNDPTAVIYLRPSRYTKKFVDEEAYFTLCVMDKSFKKQMAYLGSVSGRDEDKIAKTGLTPVFADHSVYFEEAKLVLVCKKLYQSELQESGFLYQGTIDESYPLRDFHTMYVGKIEKVLVRDDEYLK